MLVGVSAGVPVGVSVFVGVLVGVSAGVLVGVFVGVSVFVGVMVGVPAVEIVIAKVFEVAGPQFGIGVVNAGKSIFQLLMVPTSAAP